MYADRLIHVEKFRVHAAAFDGSGVRMGTPHDDVLFKAHFPPSNAGSPPAGIVLTIR